MARKIAWIGKLPKRRKSLKKKIKVTIYEADYYCGKVRLPRKGLCQLKKGHKGSCRAIIFWEDNFLNKNRGYTKW